MDIHVRGFELVSIFRAYLDNDNAWVFLSRDTDGKIEEAFRLDDHDFAFKLMDLRFRMDEM